MLLVSFRIVLANNRMAVLTGTLKYCIDNGRLFKPKPIISWFTFKVLWYGDVHVLLPVRSRNKSEFGRSSINHQPVKLITYPENIILQFTRQISHDICKIPFI